MSIKHGNKMLREQQSDLREKIRWGRIQLEEANEEIARLKQALRDSNAQISKRNIQLSGVRATNRKLRSMMNDLLLSNAIEYALEVAYTKPNFDLFNGLRDKFKEEVKKEVEG